MATPLETILARLVKVQRSGTGYRAICPAHQDRTPSLSVKEGNDGCVLVHCFAGCDVGSIVAAIGLRTADLFHIRADSPRKSKSLGVSIRELTAATEFERQILYIVTSDNLNGRPVSKKDWERAKLALRRISMAKRVL